MRIGALRRGHPGEAVELIRLRALTVGGEQLLGGQLARRDRGGCLGGGELDHVHRRSRSRPAGSGPRSRRR